MKKMIIAILMALCVVSGLSAVEYTVIETRDYSPVVLGANFVFKPVIYTGGKDVAQRDMLELLSRGVFRSGYNATNLVSSQQNLSCGLDGYLYVALDKKKGVGADVTYMFQEGFDSHFEPKDSDGQLDYVRAFSVVEVYPHYRNYFVNDSLGWVAAKIGPNIAITGDTTEIRMAGTEMDSPVKLQNDILYGIRGGFDAGLIMGKWLMSYDFTVTYDLNKTYHSADTGYIFSQNLEEIGNRISFNIGFGYGLKF
ncbi:MAG: hypothetical protein KBT02_11405 [Treponema sp.]|nr:hypothetical protein [Candidatus Treponema caballi]